MIKPTLILSLALLSAVLLSACGGASRIDPIDAVSAPSVDIADEGPRVSSVWRARIGGVDKANDRLEPVLDGDTLFVASSRGAVQAVDAQTGRVRWSSSVEPIISGGVGVGEGLVAVGTRDGQLMVFSAESGELQWTARVGSEVLAPPRIDQGVVATRTGDGAVFVFDADSGDRRWLYSRSVPTLSVRGHSAPVFVRNGLVAAFDNGRISALDLESGSRAWEATVSAPEGRTDLDRMVDIDADPVVDGGAIYVGSYQGRLVRMRLSSGEVDWARPISLLGGIAIDESQLYATDEQGRLWALDRSNGATMWRLDALEGLELSAPIRHGDYLLVGGSDGNVYWVEPNTGRIVARRTIGSARIAAQAVVQDTIAYILDLKGRLQALELEN